MARELQWLLTALQDTLQALKAGLEEVAALLAPSESGSTLALSSYRSENLKGFVTRVGTRIVKGDVKLRLSTLPPPRGSSSYPIVISAEPHASPLVLSQLTAARTVINACLDVVDISTWAGDAKDPSWMQGQLRLLDVNIQEAKNALKGGGALNLPWWKVPTQEDAITPALPPYLSIHFSVTDAALVLEVRTLEPTDPQTSSDYHSSFSLRDRLGLALGTSKPPAHDEVDDIFTWRGQEVKVREKLRVESSDPNLMAALAKLISLERAVALAREGLNTVMGKDEDD